MIDDKHNYNENENENDCSRDSFCNNTNMVVDDFSEENHISKTKQEKYDYNYDLKPPAILLENLNFKENYLDHRSGSKDKILFTGYFANSTSKANNIDIYSKAFSTDAEENQKIKIPTTAKLKASELINTNTSAITNFFSFKKNFKEQNFHPNIYISDFFSHQPLDEAGNINNDNNKNFIEVINPPLYTSEIFSQLSRISNNNYSKISFSDLVKTSETTRKSSSNIFNLKNRIIIK